MTPLDIISDPVCPWCYIGAANLAKALSMRDAQPFSIRWRPFQLNPDLPPEGMDRSAYLEAKFGGPENAARIYARIEAKAAEAGVEVDFNRIGRAPNTLDAHRVIHWASAANAQTAVKYALFRRYFADGEDISDAAVLRAAAEEAGLDGAAIARLLDGDADRDLVRTEAEQARAMGVTGVPTFVIGGKFTLTGAQPPEVWGHVIDELMAAKTT